MWLKVLLLLIFIAKKESNKMNHEDVDTCYVIAICLCSTKLLVYIFIQISKNPLRREHYCNISVLWAKSNLSSPTKWACLNVCALSSSPFSSLSAHRAIQISRGRFLREGFYFCDNMNRNRSPWYWRNCCRHTAGTCESYYNIRCQVK